MRGVDRDTVASVGFVVGRSLPFVNVNTTIKVFRQALALDEVSMGDVISCQEGGPGLILAADLYLHFNLAAPI
jgi:hypothetical protein